MDFLICFFSTYYSNHFQNAFEVLLMWTGSQKTHWPHAVYRCVQQQQQLKKRTSSLVFPPGKATSNPWLSLLLESIQYHSMLRYTK